MVFQIQHPTSGLFWSVNPDDVMIRLSTTGSNYTQLENSYLKNVDTGMYVRHQDFVMKETDDYGAGHDFEWTIGSDGTLTTPFGGGFVVSEDLKVVQEGGFQWTIVSEDDDVPVNPDAALIEEALNKTVQDAFAPAPEPVEEPAPAPEPTTEEPAPAPAPESTPAEVEEEPSA